MYVCGYKKKPVERDRMRDNEIYVVLLFYLSCFRVVVVKDCR